MAAEPQEQELELYCRGHALKNLDSLSLSDPQLYLYIYTKTNQLFLVGRTEEIKDNLDPVWKVTFCVPAVEDINLRFVCYDIDKKSEDLMDQELIGAATVSTTTIMQADGSRVSFSLNTKSDELRGKLEVVGRTVPADGYCSLDLHSMLREMSKNVKYSSIKFNNKKVNNAFSGEAAVLWLSSSVARFKGDKERATSELQFCLSVGYLSSVTPSRIFKASNTSYYSFNEYILEEEFRKDVLLPLSTMYGAEKDMDAIPGAVTLITSSSDLPEFSDTTLVRFGTNEDPAGAVTVSAATPHKLVELMTHRQYPDHNLIDVFLLTYRRYIPASALINSIRARFDTAHTDSPQDQKVVQARLLSLIRTWTTTYPLDFKDEEVYEALSQHLSAIADVQGFARTVGQIQMTIDSARLVNVRVQKARINTKVSLSTLTFASVAPLDLARQLTLVEHDLYKSIRAESECMSCCWSKTGKETKAPNVLALIDWFNYISCHVRDFVVQEETIEGRAAAVTNFVLAAKACVELSNYNGAMEILSGLNSTPVHRLYKTWEVVNSKKKIQAALEELQTTLSSSKNFKSYRAAIADVPLPAVPYLGLFLTDLTFLEDGTADKTPDGLINFVKCRKVHGMISRIQYFQNISYNLAADLDVQAFIVSMGDPMTEEEAYACSLKVEKRDRPPPDINQLADQSSELVAEVKELKTKILSLEAIVSQLMKQNEDANETIQRLVAHMEVSVNSESPSNDLANGRATLRRASLYGPATAQKRLKIMDAFSLADNAANQTTTAVTLTESLEDESPSDGGAANTTEDVIVVVDEKDELGSEEGELTRNDSNSSVASNGGSSGGTVALATGAGAAAGPGAAAGAAGAGGGTGASASGGTAGGSTGGSLPTRTSSGALRPRTDSAGSSSSPRQGSPDFEDNSFLRRDSTSASAPVMSPLSLMVPSSGSDSPLPSPRSEGNLRSATSERRGSIDTIAGGGGRRASSDSGTGSPLAEGRANRSSTLSEVDPDDNVELGPVLAKRYGLKYDKKRMTISEDALAALERETTIFEEQKFGSIEKEGWLLKKSGAAFGAWQKRYCVARDGALCYYKAATDAQPAGVIALNTSSAPVTIKVSTGGKKNAFQISFGEGSRTYHFMAEGPEDMEKWMEALQDQARVSEEGGGGGGAGAPRRTATRGSMSQSSKSSAVGDDD